MHLWDFGLLPHCRWDVHSSEWLHSIVGFVTDILGQYVQGQDVWSQLGHFYFWRWDWYVVPNFWPTNIHFLCTRLIPHIVIQIWLKCTVKGQRVISHVLFLIYSLVYSFGHIKDPGVKQGVTTKIVPNNMMFWKPVLLPSAGNEAPNVMDLLDGAILDHRE